MSDPGLYTHLYTQLRDCAELIDHVIIDLESTGNVAGKRQREALVELLRTLQSSPTSTLNTTLLVNVLRARKPTPQANWGEIADALDRGDSSQTVIKPLEELARVLESERADMYSRIHGAHAR